jgi:hypothetical protein
MPKEFSDITDGSGEQAQVDQDRRRQRLLNAKQRRKERASQNKRQLEAVPAMSQSESGQPDVSQVNSSGAHSNKPAKNNKLGTPIITADEKQVAKGPPGQTIDISGLGQLSTPIATADEKQVAMEPQTQTIDISGLGQLSTPAPTDEVPPQTEDLNISQATLQTNAEVSRTTKRRRARPKANSAREPISFKGFYGGQESTRFLQVTLLEAQMITNSDTIRTVNAALEENITNFGVTNSALMPKQLRVKLGKESKFTSVQHARVGGSKGNVLFWLWADTDDSKNCCELEVPPGTKYVCFEMLSDARPIRRKLLLSSLASFSKPGAEEELWFDLKRPKSSGEPEHIKVHLKLRMWKVKTSHPNGNRNSTGVEEPVHCDGHQGSRPLSSCVIEQLRLKNAELCQTLNVPKLNQHLEPMSMKNVSIQDCNRFLIHDFAADLVQHRQEAETLMAQLSGGVLNTGVLSSSGSVDVDVEMSILMLAGDGRLRNSSEMEALHEDLLPLLELEELDPRNKLLSPQPINNDFSGSMPAQQLQHLQYQPHLVQLLNEWFARGIAGAVARSAEKGRGVCVLDSGYETELVSRFAHHLAMWRLPTLRIVGAALNGDNSKPVKSDRLDVNHSHFVVCARPENLRGMGTDMSMCRVSAGVDAAEKLSSAFQQTKEALLSVHDAAQRLQQDQEMLELQSLQPTDRGGKKMRFGNDKGQAKIHPGMDHGSGNYARRGTMIRLKDGVGVGGSQTKSQVAAPRPIKNVPKICLLINGGERAKIDVLQAVRHSWDIIVVKGTGGLADWIALNAEILRRQQMGPTDLSAIGGKRKKTDSSADDELGGIPKKLLPPFDPVVDEIVSYGKMTVLSLQNDSVEDVARLLAARLNRSERMLGERDAILEHAWQLYGTFHASAREEGWWNSVLSQSYIFLSLLTTFLAVVAMQVQESEESSSVYDHVSTAIAIAPIFLAVVTAIKSRFHDAQRWMRMHWIGEQIRREIFLYRTHTAPYQQPRFRRQQMAKRLGDCERSLMGSEASYAKLVDLDAVYSTDWLYKPKVRSVVLGLQTSDDILQPVSAEQYVKHRLEERLQYHRQQATQQNAKLSWFSWTSYLLGGASTILVMLQALQWAALTVAMQFMLSTLISTEAFEVNMVRANSTSMALAQIKDWWDALGETEQMEMSNRQTLTKSTESVLDNHLNGWLAAMNVGADNLDEEEEDSQPSTADISVGTAARDGGDTDGSSDLGSSKIFMENREPDTPKELSVNEWTTSPGRHGGAIVANVPDLRLGSPKRGDVSNQDEGNFFNKAGTTVMGGDESDEEESNLKTARTDSGHAHFTTYTARGDALETDRTPEIVEASNPHTYRRGDPETGAGPSSFAGFARGGDDGGAVPQLEGAGRYEEVSAQRQFLAPSSDAAGNSDPAVLMASTTSPLQSSPGAGHTPKSPLQPVAPTSTKTTNDGPLTDTEKVRAFGAKSRLIKMLLNWARMCMPHRQGQANELSTSLAAKRGGNCELRLTMRSGAHANAMVLPNTTDFRTVPEHTVHKFILRDLFTFLRVSAVQEALNQRHEAEQVVDHHHRRMGNIESKVTGAEREAEVATIGLGVIVVAGEGDFSAFPPAPGSVGFKRGAAASDLNSTQQKLIQHHRTIGEKRLRQFLCRGLPDAIKRLAERHVGVVVVDSGNDSAVTSLITNSLSSWGFPGVRVLGVLESADGHPDFSCVDMKHTHFISLKQRRTTDEVIIPDRGIRETSAKVDVAHKLGHCFCSDTLTKLARGAGANESQGSGLGMATSSGYGNSQNGWVLDIIPVPYNRYMLPTNIELYCPQEELARRQNNTGEPEHHRPTNVRQAALLRDVSGSRLRDSFASGRRQLVLSGHLRRAVEDSGRTEVSPKEMQWSMPDALLHLVHGPPTSWQTRNLTPDFPVMKIEPHGYLAAATEYAGTSTVSDNVVGFTGSLQLSPGTAAASVNGAMLMDSDIAASRTSAAAGMGEQAVDSSFPELRVAPSSYLMILIGGGEKARVDCMQACRLGWDLLVFQGTGGLADEIASELIRLKQFAAKSDGRSTATSASNKNGENGGVDGFGEVQQDHGGAANVGGAAKANAGVCEGPGPVVEEIISTGKIALISVWEQGDSIEEVANVVHSRLQKDVNVFSGDPARGARLEHVLLHAWTLFAEYLLSARKLQRRSHLLEGAMMFLALLTTLLVAWDSDLRFNENHWSSETRSAYERDGAQSLRVFAALAPVLVSVMLSIKNKFNFVAKYTAFAEAASAIKREIFEYRTNTDNYRDPTRRNHQLAHRLKEITNNLLNTEASAVGVDPLRERINLRDSSFRQAVLELHPDDDGVCNIDVSEYLEYRMDFQLDKYRSQARWLHRALTVLTYLGYIFTGLCTALVLVNEQVWVVCIIMLLNVTANIVAIGMLEDRLMRTNDAIVAMHVNGSRWNTLSEGDQIKYSLVDKCVSTSENVIMAHTLGGLPRQGGIQRIDKEAVGGSSSEAKAG